MNKFKKISILLALIFLLAGFAYSFPPSPPAASVSTATTTVSGKVELATDAETQTGTATDRAITPANLQACTATDARKGVVELANTTEVAAGTDTERAVTPAGIAAVFQYDTIYIPAGSMTITTTNGATAGQYEYATQDINSSYLAFDGATEKFCEYEFPLPENWDRGTVKVKFFWSSAAGSTAGDTVEWEVAAGAQSDNDTIDAALGTAQVISDTLLADNGTKRQLSGATPALTIGGTPALGDMVHWKFSRNVGGTDDMTEAAWLFGVWIQYKIANTVAAW